MAFDNPPYVMDGTDIDGEVIRRAIGTLIPGGAFAGGGVVTPGDLMVTQQATPNMSVQIGTGEIWVPGTAGATQGPYYSRNHATVTVPIAASNPGNPRVDTIIVQVEDSTYAGGSDLIQPAVVLGTPTGGVTVPPTTEAQAAIDGAGTVPASSYILAYVLVPASASSIVTADIATFVAANFQGNTDWIALTLGTGISAATTSTSGGGSPYTPSCRILNGEVQLKGGLLNTSGSSIPRLTTLATVLLPPPGLVSTVAAINGPIHEGTAERVQIQPDGTIATEDDILGVLNWLDITGISYPTTG